MPSEDRDWAKFAGAGLEIAIGVALGLLFGHWLDGKFQTAPLFMIIGAVLGFIAGIYLLLKEAIRANKD
jgi:ATP synthase protein I